MDGENNGSKSYEQMDDLRIPLFLETPTYCTSQLEHRIDSKLPAGKGYGKAPKRLPMARWWLNQPL